MLLCFFFCPSTYRYGKLEELLEKSFPLVKMPSIQPVVMQVLKHLPKASVFRGIPFLLKTKNCNILQRGHVPCLHLFSTFLSRTLFTVEC